MFIFGAVPKWLREQFAKLSCAGSNPARASIPLKTGFLYFPFSKMENRKWREIAKGNFSPGGGMVDAQDLKSCGNLFPCRFNSGLGHQQKTSPSGEVFCCYNSRKTKRSFC